MGATDEDWNINLSYHTRRPCKYQAPNYVTIVIASISSLPYPPSGQCLFLCCITMTTTHSPKFETSIKQTDKCKVQQYMNKQIKKVAVYINSKISNQISRSATKIKSFYTILNQYSGYSLSTSVHQRVQNTQISLVLQNKRKGQLILFMILQFILYKSNHDYVLVYYHFRQSKKYRILSLLDTNSARQQTLTLVLQQAVAAVCSIRQYNY